MCKMLIVLSLLSANLFADGYMNCSKNAETDILVTIPAPQKLRLDLDQNVEVRADGRLLRNLRLSETRKNVYTFSRSTIKQGNVIEVKYTFDFRKCDSQQTGTATFSTNLTGQSDGLGNGVFGPTLATYDCTCAED